jgi:DNA repair exonuclease SbcCD ATPase subunit
MHKASRKVIEYINELTDISTKLEAEKAALAEWQSVFDAYPSPGLSPDEVRASIRTLQNEIMVLKNERLELLQKKASYDTYRPIAEALPDLIAEDLILGSTLADVERRVAEAVKGLDENFFDPKKLDSLRDYRTSLLGEKASYETMVTSFEEAEKKYKEEEARLKEITGKKLPELEDKKAKVTAVKEAFGSNGIKSVVVDYMIPRFEERINEVLSRLSEFQVRLDTQTEKAGGDGMKEGLFITILSDTGEEMPYEAYSGGEKLKITVAISEALASLQKVGFRIYDEVFIGLDEESTDAFAQVLERLQSRFSQVVCISHLGQIKDLFDYRLTLTKSNGISMITT